MSMLETSYDRINDSRPSKSASRDPRHPQLVVRRSEEAGNDQSTAPTVRRKDGLFCERILARKRTGNAPAANTAA